MDERRVYVEPFAQLFTKNLRNIGGHLLNNETPEEVRGNIQFIMGLKNTELHHPDTRMTAYYLKRLQEEDFSPHKTRLTHQRMERVIAARERAIKILAINTQLLYLTYEDVPQRNFPKTALSALPIEAFGDADAVESPKEYQAKDELFLEYLGIKLLRRTH